MRIRVVWRRLHVHRLRNAETRWHAERVSRSSVPMARASRESRKRRHSRSRQAKVQDGKKEVTRRIAVDDTAGDRRAGGAIDGKDGDRHDIAERKWTKSREAKCRPAKESTKKTTEIQYKGHDPVCPSGAMGPEETAGTNKEGYEERCGQDSDQADLAKPSPPLKATPWSTWEGAWWWKKSFDEIYRTIQKIDRTASVIRIANRSAWPMLLMWLATKEARDQAQWEEIEDAWRKGDDDALLELTAAVPLLDTPYRRSMARRQLDKELKRRRLPETRGVTIKKGTTSAKEAAKKAGANERAVFKSYSRHEGERTRNVSTRRQEQKMPVDHQEVPLPRGVGRVCDELKNMEVHTEHEARGDGRDEKKTQAGRAGKATETVRSDGARKRQMDPARVLQHQIKVSRHERPR